ncbi:MAG TPA: recombinase family protein [Clostridiales bacterium]|nr:recombinase family protein [Clostridiales bacterium]
MAGTYAIYLRKSRADTEAEQRGDGETLARHRRTLLDLAEKVGLEVTHIYHEVVSGETIADRPEMQRLLSDVEKALWAGVIVMEVERLARGETIDQGIVQRAFMYSGTKIITPMKIYDPNDEFDQEYFEFGLFMSRREYKMINRRMQRGRAASAKEGKFAGNKAPYGYRRVKLASEKGWTLEPVPEEAAIIRMIFNWYANGENDGGKHRRIGISRICRKLNSLGIPAATGGLWVPGTLHNMIRNPVYAGSVRWNARATVKKIIDGEVIKTRPRARDPLICPGRHEAIIPKALFDQAQTLLSGNPPPPVPGQAGIKNPLSGLVICGCCGRKLVRRPHASGYPDTLMCPLAGCPTVSAPLKIVEERILEGIAQWVKDYRLKWEKSVIPADTGQPDFLRSAVEKARAQITALEVQRGSLHDLLEQGVYSADTFLSRSRDLAGRISAAEAEAQALETLLAEAELAAAGKKSILPKAEKLLDIYDSLAGAQSRNALLKEVIFKIVYTKEKGVRRHGSPDDFSITLYPKLPEDISYAPE